MRDPIIRQAFHNSVLQSEHKDGNTFVVNELGLKNGVVRADIAVLNGHLIGYEIKSEKDNLSRLPSQVNAYSQVFDKAYIIVSDNHLSKAMTHIPDWWGIYSVKASKTCQAKFKKIRIAKKNKQQNAFAIAQLLWKTEALDLANSILPQKINPRITRKKLYDLISQNCSPQELSKIVIQYLKQRENWRSNLIQP